MKRREENILKNSFPLFSASLVAQGINFLVVFILPFFFSTESIGQFFVFYAIGQILIPLISLQSQNAIVLSRSQNVAKSNLLNTILIGTFNSAVFFIVAAFLFLLKDIIPAFWRDWILFFPLFVLSGTLILAYEQYLVFCGDFKKIGFLKLIRSVTVLGLVMLFGFFFPASIYIIIAFTAAQIIVFIFLFFSVGVSFKEVRFSVPAFKWFVLRYRQIIIFNTLINGLLLLVVHLPTVILSFYFGDRIVALYGMAHKFFSTLPGVYSQSVSQVLYNKCVSLYNDSKPMLKVVKRSFEGLLIRGVLYGLVGMAMATYVFKTFFADEWGAAAPIARILIPLIVAQTLVSPFTVLFTIFNRQKRVIWFYLGGFFTRIVGGLVIPLALFRMDYQSGLMIFSLIGVLYYFIYFRELYGFAKKYDRQLIKISG